MPGETTANRSQRDAGKDGVVDGQQRREMARQHIEQERLERRWRAGDSTAPSIASTRSPEWRQRHWRSRLLHRVGDITARASVGIGAFVLLVAWLAVALVNDFAEWWLAVLFGVTGSVTFVMVFVIQHTQERQTSATQRKLDELIRTSARADDALIAVEEATDEELRVLGDLNVADRERTEGMVCSSSAVQPESRALES